MSLPDVAAKRPASLTTLRRWYLNEKRHFCFLSWQILVRPRQVYNDRVYARFDVIMCRVHTVQVHVQRVSRGQQQKFIQVIKLSFSDGFREHVVTLQEKETVRLHLKRRQKIRQKNPHRWTSSHVNYATAKDPPGPDLFKKNCVVAVICSKTS